jgi:hypothetical protein
MDMLQLCRNLCTKDIPQANVVFTRGNETLSRLLSLKQNFLR